VSSTPASGDSQVLHLAGELTIYTAAEIKPQLIAVLESAAEPAVDLEAVSEVDTAGLQLLILAKQEAQRLGKQVRYLNHSSAVVEILEFCHLSDRFADPIAS